MDNDSHVTGNDDHVDVTGNGDDVIKNPLYVVENGKEYRLVPLKQRRKLFELLNGKKEVDKSKIHNGAISSREQNRKDEPTVPRVAKNNVSRGGNSVEKVNSSSSNLTSPELDCQTGEKSNGTVVKCGEQGCQEPLSIKSNNETVKSLNVPYIVEEQEVLQNIHLVKNLKNMFLKN